MDREVAEITIQGLMLVLVPTAITIGILFRWAVVARTAVYVTTRMLIQLLLICLTARGSNVLNRRYDHVVPYLLSNQ